MRERPILMNAPMVRAILAGTKRQTRRPVKIPAGICAACRARALPHPTTPERATPYLRVPACECSEPGTIGGRYPAPCDPGDTLWVRETWAVGACASGFSPLELHAGTWLHDNGGCWYRADDAAPPLPISPRGKWRPSILMPRWAARLFLRVTGVRVERVQDISEEDAIAEGFEPIAIKVECPPPSTVVINGVAVSVASTAGGYISARDAFEATWRALYGDSWDRNDWVWVVAFEKGASA
jgi:hypothetical protein